MTKSILTLLSIFLFTAMNYAGDIPSEVQKAFSQKFPGAEKVKWKKENAHEYEASFKLNGVNYSANFNNTGEWLETESEIKFIQLPEKVKKAFNISHVGGTVAGAAKIETAKGVIKYEVEFKQGNKTVEVFYTSEGTEIRNK